MGVGNNFRTVGLTDGYFLLGRKCPCEGQTAGREGGGKGHKDTVLMRQSVETPPP